MLNFHGYEFTAYEICITLYLYALYIVSYHYIYTASAIIMHICQVVQKPLAMAVPY